MIGNCKKCGYQAGVLKLKNGLCESCFSSEDGNKGSNIEASITKERKLGIPITLFVSAAAIVLAKPLIIKIILPLTSGHGRGLSGELSRANYAANISGTCDIIAAIIALIGGYLLVRSFLWEKK